MNTAPDLGPLKAISVVFQESAGGLATDGEKPILDVVPSGLHDRTPIILGSPGNCIIKLIRAVIYSFRNKLEGFP